MKKYTRISLEEREKIYLWQKAGLKISAIAKKLCRHKSSIFGELKRYFNDLLGYLPDRAHAVYQAGLARNKALFLDERLQEYVIAKLTKFKWTPKEISAGLRLENTGIKASPETIYQFIYMEQSLYMNQL